MSCFGRSFSVMCCHEVDLQGLTVEGDLQLEDQAFGRHGQAQALVCLMWGFTEGSVKLRSLQDFR